MNVLSDFGDLEVVQYFKLNCCNLNSNHEMALQIPIFHWRLSQQICSPERVKFVALVSRLLLTSNIA